LLTIGLLKKHWQQHPPLFRIGMAPVSEWYLPFAGDPRSWIEVIHSGCTQLREKGFQSVYLILDDHPPVGPCHEGHLNETLPGAMAALGACYINLAGWDGMTYVQSQAVQSGVRGLRRLGPGFQFHFQLHPALWNLKMLEELSRRFLDAGFRTAWDFESAARSLFSEFPREWQEGAYVIQGRALKKDQPGRARIFSGMRAWGWRLLDRWSRQIQPERFFSSPVVSGYFLRRYLRMGRRDFCKMNSLQRMQAFASRFFKLPPETTAKMKGGDFRKQFRSWLKFDRCVYEGPYPVYRNGFLMRGVLNGFFLDHLRETGQQEAVKELIARYPLAPGS
jgi:hypothetical protein